MVSVPLLRLPAAERETGGVAVEVLGAGEIKGASQGLDAADPADLGDPVAGRDSPSLVAYRFRPQEGQAPAQPGRRRLALHPAGGAGGGSGRPASRRCSARRARA